MNNIKTKYIDYLKGGQEKDSGLFNILNKVKEARDKLLEASEECKINPMIDEKEIVKCYENLNSYYENLSMQAPYVDTIKYGKIPNTSINMITKKGDS